MIIKVGPHEFQDWQAGTHIVSHVIRQCGSFNPVAHGIYIDIEGKLSVSIFGDKQLESLEPLLIQLLPDGKNIHKLSDLESLKNQIDCALIKIAKLIHFK